MRRTSKVTDFFIQLLTDEEFGVKNILKEEDIKYLDEALEHHRNGTAGESEAEEFSKKVSKLSDDKYKAGLISENYALLAIYFSTRPKYDTPVSSFLTCLLHANHKWTKESEKSWKGVLEHAKREKFYINVVERLAVVVDSGMK